jgi:zinc transport system ATP-binding protein
MALLTCCDLALGYEGEKIIEGLNFSVAAGSYLCVVGENGSGKSTLMKTILGLKAPLAGKIEFGDGLKRNDLGYLPQRLLLQKDFPASVGEIVLSGCLNGCGMRPFYGRKEKETALKNMARLGIADIARRCYRELSGGQQQRVLLARAICAARRLLLLDEPAAGLDPGVTAEMYGVVGELNRSEGVTVIMITHDVNAALKYATHILHLGSRQLFFGPKEEYVKTDICHRYAAAARGDL